MPAAVYRLVPPRAQVYCLPDNYEVLDRSLDDIRAVLNPAFSTQVRVVWWWRCGGAAAAGDDDAPPLHAPCVRTRHANARSP